MIPLSLSLSFSLSRAERHGDQLCQQVIDVLVAMMVGAQPCSQRLSPTCVSGSIFSVIETHWGCFAGEEEKKMVVMVVGRGGGGRGGGGREGGGRGEGGRGGGGGGGGGKVRVI